MFILAHLKARIGHQGC